MGSSAARKIDAIFSGAAPAFREKLNECQGHFAFIVDTPEFTLACVDKIRSTPLFYSSESQSCYISNSARRLQSKRNLFRPHADSILEFNMAGYVTGLRSLCEDLFQLQAGEYLFVDKKSGQVQREDYYLFSPNKLNPKSDDELLDELDQVSRKVFFRLIESLNGRPVWLPLSGGLDSRWILAMLRELKYDRIVTFSYGKPGHPEVARAKIIAEKLSVSWRFVEYPPQRTRRLYDSDDRRKYSDFADGLSSVPALNDYYAISFLQEQDLIPHDAIFINGQTGDFLTGGHIPKNIVRSSQHPRQFILEEIISKHLSLWINLKTPENLKRVSANIIEQLHLDDKNYSQQEVAQKFELWEWRERQAKFVVNGQRIYEWFGYDWRLPCWDDELMLFWQNIPWNQRFQQALHKKYLNTKNFGGVFNDFYMGPHPLQNWERLAIYALIFYGKMSKQEPQRLIHKYLEYFTNYAPFYIQKSYREFLKDSYWHRNACSYFVKDYLKTNHFQI